MEIEVIDLADAAGSGELQRKWDRLWEADPSQLPNGRWEHLKLWFDQFAPHAPRRAVVVQDAGEWLAAFPWAGRRLRGLVPLADAPYSPWTPTPQFLVDPRAANIAQVAATLVRGLQRAKVPLLRISELQKRPESDHLLHAIRGAGWRFDVAPRYEIGQLQLRGPQAPADWAAYQKQLSGNFRRKIGKMLRRAESLGGIELLVVQPSTEAEIVAWLRTGFEIEDRSWKGPAGCSVLRTPGMLEFYQRQARLLAARGELALLFLKHQEQLIAFQYGWRVGRTYYSPKIGYDEAFAHLSPGHLLMHLWIERMFASDEFDTFDFAGPVSDSTSGWITTTYRIDRLLAGTGWWGNQLLACGQIARAAKHWLKSRNRPADSDGGESDQAEVLATKPGSGSPPADGTNDNGRQRQPDRRPSSPPVLPSLDDNALPAESTSVVP